MRIAGGALALVVGAVGLHAQATPAAKPMTRTERTDLREQQPLTTFYLKNGSQPNDGNEILTGLRLMLDPGIKLYLLPSQSAIVMKALPEEVATAAKLIAEMDRPRKIFRLSYALTEIEGGKRLGTQHFVMTATDGQRTTLKSGTRVPISTGKFEVTNEISETQLTYLDVGYILDATPSSTASGATLKSKVERSAVVEEKPGTPAPVDPSIHEAVMEGVTFLPLGKPTVLGSLDVPDSTKKLEVEVTLEVVP